MTEPVTLYYLLAFVGLVAISTVIVLYVVQKNGRVRKANHNVGMNEQAHVFEKDGTGDGISIRNALALHRDDQPVFLKVAEDFLTRVRSYSEVKVIEQVVREFEVSADFIDRKKVLVEKMEAYRDAHHSYQMQPVRHQRRDEEDERIHEREMERLKADINQLRNPPPPPKERQPLTSSDIVRLKKEERERQLEEARLALEHEVRYRQMKEDILGAYEEEQRKKHTRQLDRIKNELAERRADIQADPTLSPLEKENHLRALQKDYMRQLDEFEAKL